MDHSVVDELKKIVEQDEAVRAMWIAGQLPERDWRHIKIRNNDAGKTVARADSDVFFVNIGTQLMSTKGSKLHADD